MNLSSLPIQKFFDNNGNPLNGGLLFTYVAGTTTKIATYTDSTGGTPNTNPVVLNFRGEANVWLDPTLTYKFTLAPVGDTDPPSKPIWTVDNIASGVTLATLTQQILGQILYRRTANEIAAGVTPVQFFYPPGNVLRYGVNTSPGTTNMTTAFNNAWLAYKDIYFPEGIYLVDTLTLPSTYYQRSLVGDGPGLSVLKQSSANGDVIAGTSSGNAEHSLKLQDFSIVGTLGGTGNGIFLPANGGNPMSNMIVRRVTINNMGGRGIYDLCSFVSTYENVQISGCLDNQFDLIGGNSLLLTNCYAQNIPTAGKAGYRVHAGTPVFNACTGINSGQYWGIFGDIPGEDGTTSFCRPTIIGCDIEDYGLVGIRNKNNGTVFINTAMLAPVAGVVTAYLQDTQNNEGFCDNVAMFSGTKGATFANGQPIHTKQNAAPFAFAANASVSTANTYQFYDEVGALTYTVGAVNTVYGGNQRWGMAPGILSASQLIQRRAALTYSASMTPDVSTGNSFTITITNGTAFTFNAPLNPMDGQRMLLLLRNTSGGAHGAITWNGIYKVQAAAVVVANGSNRMIEFQYDGANWVEITRGYADVPN